MGSRAEPGEPETVANLGRTRSNWTIGPADESEASSVLALQRRCYAREAELYDDWTIPPLTQSLSELRGEFATHRILVARIGTTVVGSVRARLDRGTCHVGRLVVEPGHERRGIGTKLMAAIEREFPEADRFELFMGHLSEGNLALYRRLGYEETGRRTVSPNLRLVYLGKVGRVDRPPSPE